MTVTALNLYGCHTVSSLATAFKLVSNTSGSSSTNKTTLIGTATGYGEFPSNGSVSAWPAAAGLSGPSGNGYLFDVTTLEGQQLVFGNWATIHRVAITNGTATIDLITRFFKRSSGGVYTAIGVITQASQGLTTVLQTLTSANVQLAAMNFGTGDKLYIDTWGNITVNNSGNGATTYRELACNQANSGQAGNMEIDTPGYQPIPPTVGGGLYRGRHRDRRD